MVPLPAALEADHLPKDNNQVWVLPEELVLREAHRLGDELETIRKSGHRAKAHPVHPLNVDRPRRESPDSDLTRTQLSN